MAVNLGKEFSRNPNSGANRNRKTQQIPNAPSQQIGVANDPGVAGGPNLPSDFYGNGGVPGLLSTGKRLQDAGNQSLEDISRAQKAADAEALRQKIRNEEVEIGAVLSETDVQFQTMAGKVNTRIHSGPGLSQVDQYKMDSQKLIDTTMEKVNKMEMSAGSKQKLERQLEAKQNIQGSAVAKTLQDLKNKEYVDFVDRSYKSSQSRHKNDIVGWLKENEQIDKDTRLLLGTTQANEMFQKANEGAVLFKYTTAYSTGDYTAAEAALNDPAARLYLSTDTMRAKFKELLDGKIAAKASVEAQEKTKSMSRYVDLKSGRGLWDTQGGDDGTGALVPGTDDPSKNITKTDGGSFQYIADPEDSTKGAWSLIPGSKPKGTQTDAEKRKETVQFMKDHNMQLTPNRLEMLAGLVPEKMSEVKERIEGIESLNISAEQKTELKASYLSGVKKNADEKNIAFIKTLGLSEDAEKKALLAVATGNADLRNPTEKGLDEGTTAAVAKIQEKLVLDVNKFSEPFAVDSKATNSIRTLAERYVEAIQQDGRVKLIDGGAEILGELVDNAESFLKSGEANSIGQAVRMAWMDIPEDERPTLVTGLSQVQNMIRDSDNSEALIPDKTIIRDANSVAATNAQVIEDIRNLPLDGTYVVNGIPTKLSIKDATGMRSALEALAGATVAQVPGLGFLENKEVTQARLIFSLIARDVVRLVSLSPRFAVREQQLIQTMYPGPEVFNSPRQAFNKLQVMRGFIDQKLGSIQKALQRTNIEFEDETRLVGEASQLIEMKSRMNMFSFDHLIPIEEVQTPTAVRKLGKDRALKFNASLSDKERSELPTDVLRQLHIYKKQKTNKKKK